MLTIISSTNLCCHPSRVVLRRHHREPPCRVAADHYGISSSTSSSDQKHLEPPLLRLPNELLHTICTYLTPTEAASFRLLYKRIADVGVSYIVPVIYLALSEHSFNRLEAIAQHPKIRKHVSSMVFDATCLRTLDREAWEHHLYSLGMLLQRDEIINREVYISPPQSTERAAKFAAYDDWKSLPRHQYTKDELDRAFTRYERYRQEQSQLLQADAYLQSITQALANLPMLKEVVVDTDFRRTEHGLSTQKLWAAFGSGLSLKKENVSYDGLVGLSKAHAILNGAYQTRLRLESFVCTLLSWKFFSEHSHQDFASYKGSLIQLNRLELVISGVQDMDGFLECLAAGRVFKFLIAAPYLKRLRLSIFSYPGEGGMPNLEHFVGSFCWTLLVQVAIEWIETSEDVLKGFLIRNTSTLKSILFRGISLIDGNWMSIFRTMHSGLKLDEVGFGGTFWGEDCEFSMDPDTVPQASFLKHVRDYILGATQDHQPIEAYLNEHTYH